MVVTVSKGERGERGVGLENKSGEGGCVRGEGECEREVEKKKLKLKNNI
jgi:hypothetical protein